MIHHKRTKRAIRALQSLQRLTGKRYNVHSRGNRVHLFENGGDFFPALFQAIESATLALYAEFYIIKADRTGQAFAQALIAAAARGVEVALVYDFVGCYDTPSSYFKGLERAGVRCLPFNVPTFSRLRWLDRRDHRKIVVIDGRTAFLGGMNVGDEYAGYGENSKSWRDVGMRIDGPAGFELAALFRTTWQQEGADPLPELLPHAQTVPDDGDADVMIINGAPHHARSIIHGSFRLALAGARHSIRIMTPYFVPGPRVVRSLLRAFKAGVKVQLILPSISDVPLMKLASRVYLTPLVQAGVEIYELQETVLHAKVMLIDDSWATLGSANLDQRSFHRNYEINVVICSHDFGEQVQRMVEEDLRKSRRVAAEEYEHKGYIERLFVWLLAPFSRFL